MLLNPDQEYTATLETLAFALGLTERRIQQLEADEIVTRQERGKYDLWESIRGYCEFLRNSERHSATSEAEKNERVRLTRAKRIAAELQLRETAGALVKVEQMNKHHRKLARVLVSNLETIPDRIDALIANESNPDKCHRLILEAVREALADVVREMDNLEVDTARVSVELKSAESQLDEIAAFN